MTSDQKEIVSNQPQNYKLRLIGPGGTIWSETSPSFTEHRTVSYSDYSIIHLPTDIKSYSKTSARSWDITIKLVSRSIEEAQSNADYLLLARKWVLPNFGGGVGAGATPPILKLYAYANNNIKNIPVILMNYNFSFPQDVDYIYGGTEPFPVIADLTMNVIESWTPKQISEGAWQINRPDVMNYITFGNIKSNDPNDPIGRYQDSFGYSLNEEVHKEKSKYVISNHKLKEFKITQTISDEVAKLNSQQLTVNGRGYRGPSNETSDSTYTEYDYDALGNLTGGSRRVLKKITSKAIIKDSNEIPYQGVIQADFIGAL